MKKLMEKALKRAMGSKKENGKKNLKGFTLVEIIVVLVILAILAAAMIPALTGYIEKSRQKTAVSEARSVLTALQTVASEEYAKGTVFDEDNTTLTDDNIEEAAGLTDADDANINYVAVNENGKIEHFSYLSSSGLTVYYDIEHDDDVELFDFEIPDWAEEDTSEAATTT